MDKNQRRPMSAVELLILEGVFVVVFITVSFYCYQWVIAPIIPLVKDVISNEGLPSFSLGSGIDILTDSTIFGMTVPEFGIFIFLTTLRITMFTIGYKVIIKAYRLLKMTAER